MSGRTVLVAGALGLLGRAAVEHFAALEGWRVIGVSRRAPDFATTADFLSVDLTDRAACETAFGALPQVTDVVYAALYEKPDLLAGWRDAEQMAVNLAMLRNLLEPLEAAAPGLRQVSLLQGAKAYGVHLEPAPVPAKERWPRHPHDNFYWLQEDWIRERQAGKDWNFTIFRPQAVLGFAHGSPMNAVAAIGAYAALRRAQGLPLAFPGGGERVHEATDARLVARAMAWAAETPAAANETYNLHNGDALVWQHLFPRVAEVFGMDWSPEPAPQRLETEMPPLEGLWAEIAARHGLAEPSLQRLVGSSWAFTDRTFGQGHAHPRPQSLSTIKIRSHGFHDCLDTEDALVWWLERMQRERLLPA